MKGQNNLYAISQKKEYSWKRILWICKKRARFTKFNHFIRQITLTITLYHTVITSSNAIKSYEVFFFLRRLEMSHIALVMIFSTIFTTKSDCRHVTNKFVSSLDYKEESWKYIVNLKEVDEIY